VNHPFVQPLGAPHATSSDWKLLVEL